MATIAADNFKLLTHTQVRQALHATGEAMEMTCPCCGHSHLQLFGGDGIKCQNGCTTETVTAEIRRLLDTGEAPPAAGTPKPKKQRPSQLPNWQGFTLSDYCKLKGLDARVLKFLFGAHELKYKGKTVVGWPYFDTAGKVLATKLRLSDDSHDTLFSPADPHIPYGLNNPHLENLVSGTYDVFLTEGESDCHTLTCYGYLALGISGSEGWLPEFAELPVIDNARRVFVCEDQDTGGKTFVAKVLKALPQAYILRPEGVKDINDLHAKYVDFDAEENPWTQHPFVQSVDIAIQAATLEKAMRQPKSAKPKPQAMRDEAFYGLVGDFVALLEPVLETDRASILSNILACSGVLFQHAACSKAVADIHWPVDFFLTVGNSAVARKGTTTNAVLEAMDKVQPGFTDKILGGLSTGQGLVAALIKKKPEGEGEEDDVEELPEPIAASVLIEVSEFAELLAVMKRDENTLSAIMRLAWDGKTMAVTTRKDPLKVKNVSLATICHITRKELLDKLTTVDRANGFANRFLFVWTQRVKLLPKGDMSHVNFNEIVSKLHAAVEAAQGVGELKRDAETEELWAEEYKRLTARGETLTDAILSRGDAHVLRLALLYALLDSSRVVRKEHLRAALAVWDYCEESVRYVFGDASAPEQAKVLRKLEDGPLTTGEIRRQCFSDNKTSEWVAELMDGLAQLRKVRAGAKKYKTGEKEAWYLA